MLLKKLGGLLHFSTSKEEKQIYLFHCYSPPSSLLSPSAQKNMQANLKPAHILNDEGHLAYSLKLVKYLPDINHHKISL